MSRSLHFDSHHVTAAAAWHDGMSSMLYAVASTGSLSLGTIRPLDEDGEPMSDEAWFRRLCERLASECYQAALRAADDETEDISSIEEMGQMALAAAATGAS